MDPESLFWVGVDCKDCPNSTQANRFLDDLTADSNEPEFAKLLVEPSGGGVHGYAVVL